MKSRLFSLLGQFPYVLLLLITAGSFLMIFIYNDAGIIDLPATFLSAGRHTLQEPATFITGANYVDAKQEYSRYIEKDVNEGEGVLFINDQIALGQNFIYYNIYTYSDKKIRYYFEGTNITDQNIIVKKMKENNIKYVFSYKNPKPIYSFEGKDLKDKSFLLELKNDRLSLVRIYD